MKPNRDISKLTPQFQEKVIRFLEELDGKIFITEGWRSEERQKELFAQGRTTPGSIVTYVDGVKELSEHQKGNAIDIAFNGGELYPRDIEEWNKVYEVAKKYGILWGYKEWQFDKPHFFDNGKPYKKELPQYFLKDYRTIPVISSDVMCGKGASACVVPGFEKIFITPKFFEEENEFFRELLLEHEYNHIILNRATEEERKIYEMLYSISGENDFISNYAKKSAEEDFCEVGKIEFARFIMKQDIKESPILEIKKMYNRLLYNKYKD